ncbi:MAG: zinc ribbon domain-containing protein [Candidatus Odinarchaeota archaeon]
MAEAGKHVWIIPLIVGILAIGSLFAPATSMNYMGVVTDVLWMWGFYILNAPTVPEYIAHFIQNPLIITISIVSTALIAVSGLLLIIFAAKKRLRPIRNISIVAAILIIASEILWLIFVSLFFPFNNYSFWSGYPGNFWRFCYYMWCIKMHSVGFGIIGGFLAAALAFLGVGLANYYLKERPQKVPKTTKPIVSSEEKGVIAKTELLFCSECGAKIEDSNLKFCGNCGHEF